MYSQRQSADDDGSSITSEIHLTRRSELLQILVDPLKGRGVYARTPIPSNTLIEVSPALVVPASEYSAHSLSGTIFESYLFCWSKPSGDLALALGIGSLFNHSDTLPNVSYTLDKRNVSIRYTTTRDVAQGEELCIFYGHGVVFGEKGELIVQKGRPPTPEHEENAFMLMANGRDDSDEEQSVQAGGKSESARTEPTLGPEEAPPTSLDTKAAQEAQAVEKDLDEAKVLPIASLSVQQVTSILSPEDMPLETMQVYGLRINPRSSGPVLAFLRAASLDMQPAMRHCRRIKRIEPLSSTAAAESPATEPPSLAAASSPTDEQALILLFPTELMQLPALVELLLASSHLATLPRLTLQQPEIIDVPRSPARTVKQVKEWSRDCWPVSLVPVKEDVLAKERLQSWTAGKVAWMREVCESVVVHAEAVVREGAADHPVVCTVTESWDPARHHYHLTQDGAGPARPIVLATSHDTRQSSSNPLQHAVLNLLERVAHLDRTGTRPHMPASDYLLTNLTVFMSHEPCLLCSMALLHSRIACLVYVRESPGAGGCGTEYALHEQKGTNHHFECWRVRPDGKWSELRDRVPALEMDP